MSNYSTLNDIDDIEVSRISTGFRYIDKMLGGGLPLGAVSLFAGEAGTGKSRLALDIAIDTTFKTKVLYFQLEMALPMFKRYMKNRSINSNNIALSEVTSYQDIINTIKSYQPGLVIIDSVNMIDDSHNIHIVRDMMKGFMKTVKDLNCHILLIGQLGKDRKVKGSTDWVYLPDIVCHLNKVQLDMKKVNSLFDNVPKIFERNAVKKKAEWLTDCQNELKKRFLISIPSKNRFGPVGHIVTLKHFDERIKQINGQSSFDDTFTHGVDYPNIHLDFFGLGDLSGPDDANNAVPNNNNNSSNGPSFFDRFIDFCMNLRA